MTVAWEAWGVVPIDDEQPRSASPSNLLQAGVELIPAERHDPTCVVYESLPVASDCSSPGWILEAHLLRLDPALAQGFEHRERDSEVLDRQPG
jgi:hypothetical protein